VATLTAPPLDKKLFNDWLRYGERGISSDAIVERLTGRKLGPERSYGTHPYDRGDLRRCELLLRRVPAAREHLHLMKDVSPAWGALVRIWDELIALAEKEQPGFFSTQTLPARLDRPSLCNRRMDEAWESAR
jgi:hypothetical protein